MEYENRRRNTERRRYEDEARRRKRRNEDEASGRGRRDEDGTRQREHRDEDEARRRKRRNEDEMRRRERRYEELRYEERRRKRRARIRRRRILRLAMCLAVPLVVLAVMLTGRRVWLNRGEKEVPVMAYDVKYVAEAPDYMVELLDYNEYSRPGTALPEVKGIVVHYTANPGTSAENNRNYFQGLKDSGEAYASSHFVIGIEGEIIQCVPCNEIAYTSNERNADTVSIECCIPDETGKFTDATYESLLWLTSWLMGRYNLTTNDVIRHYDVNGKNCPKYFVEHEEAWLAFKEDLLGYIDANGIEKEREIR